MAISAPARRYPRVCAWSMPSSKSPMPRPREQFLAAGDHYWNSGMFMFRASDYLELLAEHARDIFDGVAAAYEKATTDIDFLRLDKASFEAVRADSIDYAVMEKTDRAVMAELDVAWSDLGSWTAVARAVGLDSRGNSAIGDVWLEDSDDCVVRSEGRLVAALGTRDQIIIETPDAVLVADRSREQDIKTLVAKLDARRPQRGHRASQVVPALGLATSRSRPGRASRSSISGSRRAAVCRCSRIITGPNTGSWCTVPPRSPATSAKCC